MVSFLKNLSVFAFFHFFKAGLADDIVQMNFCLIGILVHKLTLKVYLPYI